MVKAYIDLYNRMVFLPCEKEQVEIPVEGDLQQIESRAELVNSWKDIKGLYRGQYQSLHLVLLMGIQLRKHSFLLITMCKENW